MVRGFFRIEVFSVFVLNQCILEDTYSHHHSSYYHAPSLYFVLIHFISLLHMFVVYGR